jgi:hypothetical protein
MMTYHGRIQNRIFTANVESQQLLPLEIISPVWAERLERSKELSPLSLKRLMWYFELKNASRCVVGEAHGFSSSYMSYCTPCSKIGWKFMFYFMIRSYSRLECTKKEFVKHWLETHSNPYHPACKESIEPCE